MFWGAEVSAHYGWTPFDQRAHPEAECSYVSYYWTCGLELSLILHAWFEMTQDESVAREFLIPIADAVTEFYDQHYPRDAEGKLRIEPSQSLETWHDATNPLPDLAGLHVLLPRLLAMPRNLVPDMMQERCQRLLHQHSAHFPLLLPRQFGIADYVNDAIAQHQPIRTHHLGNRHRRSDLHGGNSCLFQLGGDRSAAASARASGGG